MAPPPLKKAKTLSASVTEPVLGPITNRDSLVESDSDHESGSNVGSLQDEGERTESSASGSDASDEVMIQSAPPSPPPTVSKRKRGRKPKQVEETEVVELGPPTTITYILTILSFEEAAKAITKRELISASLELSDKEPWDTMKAQLLKIISDTLSPQVLDFADYTCMFFIPRILPKPGMALSTDANYAALLLRARNLTSKTPTINISIQEKKKNVNKENVAVLALNSEPKETTKATKKKKEPAVLPGNVNRAANIQKLQDHWTCVVRQPGTCIGAYCYVFPDTAIHLPLNHERLECWASAMLKNDGSSTVEKPPNHRLFDPEVVPRSPVLQRRLDTQNTKAPSGSSAPVFNITLGDGVVDMFRPVRAAAPNPAVPQILAGPSVVTDKMLLKSICDVGPDMSISEFCTFFGLQPSVLQKLEANAYDFARNLRFITLDNLTEMEFKLGEKAALQDAVERWSIPRVA